MVAIERLRARVARATKPLEKVQRLLDDAMEAIQALEMCYDESKESGSPTAYSVSASQE
jgi:hypothetical protein